MTKTASPAAAAVIFTPVKPVTFKNKTYASLKLNPIRLRDVIAGERAETEASRVGAVIASMAGVPFGVVEELEMADFIRLGEIAAPLMEAASLAAIPPD